MSARNRIAPLLELPGVGRFVLEPMARSGYRQYRESGETPHRSYVAMRRLYAVDPDAFERLADAASTEHGRLDLPSDPAGVLRGHVDEAVAALDADGLYVLPSRLAPDVCDALVEIATSAACTLVDPIDGETRNARFTPDNVLAPRYDVDEAELASAAVVQRLMGDESLLSVAQRYLSTAPVQDLVAMWWSASVGGPASSAAAQKFHFDLDRLRFLKVFVYLTDVDDERGPHVLVRGTHRALPRRFRRDGRYEDAEVSSAFGPDVVRVTGERGTVFVADTRALHKGLAVERGHRLVFQMEYASSLFGQTYSRIELHHVDPAFAEVAHRYPAAFERFTLPLAAV